MLVKMESAGSGGGGEQFGKFFIYHGVAQDEFKHNYETFYGTNSNGLVTINGNNEVLVVNESFNKTNLSYQVFCYVPVDVTNFTYMYIKIISDNSNGRHYTYFSSLKPSQQSQSGMSIQNGFEDYATDTAYEKFYDISSYSGICYAGYASIAGNSSPRQIAELILF